MKRASLAASLALAFSVFSGQAFAVTMINYPVHIEDPSNNNNYLDLVITTDELGAITGFTTLGGDLFGGGAVVALADPIFEYYYDNPDPAGSDYGGTTDNLFRSPAPYVDSSGIGFGLSNISSIYRFVLFNSGAPRSVLRFCSFDVGDNRYNCTGAFQEGNEFNMTVTPLPAAFPLFATGLGLFGLLSYRRKKKMQTATNRLCPTGA